LSIADLSQDVDNADIGIAAEHFICVVSGMDIRQVITSYGASTVTVGGVECVRLFTGLDLNSGTWIVQNGFSVEKMRENYYLAKELWMTTDESVGVSYSYLNVTVNMNAGIPAVFSCLTPVSIVQNFLVSDPALAGLDPQDKAIAFQPEAFVALNAVVSSKKVRRVVDSRLEEE
jgi:hypothetical protein